MIQLLLLGLKNYQDLNWYVMRRSCFRRPNNYMKQVGAIKHLTKLSNQETQETKPPPCCMTDSQNTPPFYQNLPHIPPACIDGDVFSTFDLTIICDLRLTKIVAFYL